MANGKMVAATLIALTVVAVFISPLSTIVTESTGVVAVGNESVKIQTDSWSDLEGYDIDSSTVVVTNNGTTLSEGADYELNATDGTLRANASSTQVSDGDAVEVDYEYQATDGTTTTIAGLVPLFAGLLIIGVAANRIQEMM